MEQITEESIEILHNFLTIPQVIIGLVILRILFILLSLIMIGFIFFVMFKTSWFKRYYFTDVKEFITYKPFGSRKAQKQWKGIKERLETGMESEFKLAIMEADSFLDNTLTKMGMIGKTLPEKLDNLTPLFLENLESIKEVNRIRNSIIHDPDYRLDVDRAKEMLEVYEKALDSLQAL